MEKTRDELVLKRTALEIRRHVVRMTAEAGSGHPGGSLSATDLLTALYFGELNLRPREPAWPERDRFVLSKGHACPALYAILAELGYFPVETLLTLRKLDSILQGHPDRVMTPGVEVSNGALGHGLPFANGMALAGKLDGRSWRVYVLLGDGESQEGSVWEAAMTAAHYGLDNLCAVTDYNGLQIDGPVSEVMEVAPLAEKWRAFGWETIEVDGHDFGDIFRALDHARSHRGRPTHIVARTVKGTGVSFMENNVSFHGKAPTREEEQRALLELDQCEKELGGLGLHA
jgi:transketolase